MQLVSFSVTNYRSITHAYRLPIRQCTMLVGPNNEGKSNILKALVTALGFLGALDRFRLHRGRLRMLNREVGGYNWAKDFPISLQSRHPDWESVFRLEFKLSEAEVGEFENEVNSYLNGTLPIELSFGKNDPGFKVMKKGPGGPALSKKAGEIASFIAKRVNLTYIPAVRTSEEANNVVATIIDRELAKIETQKAYQDAMAEVAKLQTPVLESISEKIRETLKVFLPNVQGVKFNILDESRFRGLRREYEIIVDDGTATPLSRKGDGAQSLAALSLMRHSSETDAAGRQLILAIEEPESHLHPKAIHQLRQVIGDIAQKHQVIMTTHCPLFVDRTTLKANILVHRNKAAPAKNVKEIREMLGVRAADNMHHAELMLLVEGEEDKKALAALLPLSSAALKTALANHTLSIDSLLGGSNLSYKLSQAREALCVVHCFLDHDHAGIEAEAKAEREGLLTLADATFTTCLGMTETEMEDLFDEPLYAGMLLTKYGVSTQSPKFKGRNKWSDRVKEVFKHQGKTWSDQIEMRVKYDVAELVAASPEKALNEHKRSSFDALVAALESKLLSISQGKQ